jgi:Cu2+-exporting ATPase
MQGYTTATTRNPRQNFEGYSCAHCGLDIPPTLINKSRFCCTGCESVFLILNELGLEQFYELKRATGADLGPQPSPGQIRYDYFDDEAFWEEHVDSTHSPEMRVSLYLAGVHCAACVWLLEKLPECLPGVLSAKLQLSSSVLYLRYDAERIRLSEIARFIDSLGYQPVAVSPDALAKGRRAERRMLLLRIAVAGLAAGNAMMLAVSLFQGWFSGMDTHIESLFVWLSCAIAFPAVTFSAVPFYRAAYASVSMRKLHIDLPISIGIVAGYTLSIVNTIAGNSHVYYDSVCMLIFLLLVGRWLQRDGLDRTNDKGSLLYALAPSSALRRGSEGQWTEVYSGSLKVGDIVLVPADARIPADGILASDSAHIDCSLLTGESGFERKSRGDQLFAGTVNRSSSVEVAVTAVHQTTRLGKLLAALEASQAERSPLVQLTDRVAGRFVSVVLVVASATALYWGLRSGASAAIERTLAVLVVSCPCALGLAAPVSFSVALRSAARRGIFVRSAAALEAAAKVTTVFLDKTGTLTVGRPDVRAVHYALDDLTGDKDVVSRTRSLVASLEQHSHHPLASALRRWSAGGELIADISLSEHDGCGIEGTTGSCRVLLGSVQWSERQGVTISESIQQQIQQEPYASSTLALLSQNSRAIALFAIGDDLREEARAFVKKLVASGYRPEIISGDRTAVVRDIAAQVGIPADQARGELSPEEKMAIIERAEDLAPTMMLGDGANDAGALRAARVGVALHGGAEASIRVAEVFLSPSQLFLSIGLLEGAKQTQRVIRRSLIFSAFYNIIGTSLAVMGVLGPLGAAILMPISSATVILSALSLMRWPWGGFTGELKTNEPKTKLSQEVRWA